MRKITVCKLIIDDVFVKYYEREKDYLEAESRLLFLKEKGVKVSAVEKDKFELDFNDISRSYSDPLDIHEWWF